MCEPNKSLNRLIILPIYEPNTCYNRLMSYNWQENDWPEFRYDLSGAGDALLAFAERTGQASGLLLTYSQVEPHMLLYPHAMQEDVRRADAVP